MFGFRLAQRSRFYPEQVQNCNAFDEKKTTQTGVLKIYDFYQGLQHDKVQPLDCSPDGRAECAGSAAGAVQQTQVSDLLLQFA